MPLKISYSFKVPYLLRIEQGRTFSILIDDQVFHIQVKNKDGYEFLPWLKGGGGASNLVFMHPEENFNLDQSTHRSEIIITFKIQGIKALKLIPKYKFTIFNWAKDKKIEFPYADRLLGFFQRKVIKAYDRFLRFYTFFAKEIYNAGYIEPIFQLAFPFGVKIYVDDVFQGIYFPTINISLNPLEKAIDTQIEEALKNGEDIDPVSDLEFQSLVAYEKRNFRFAMLLCAEYLEVFIDDYLLQSPKFEVRDRGTFYELSKKGKCCMEQVNTSREYDEVLNDFRKVSLFSYNNKLWDNLDKIVQLRNRLMHKYELKYVESDYHYKKRNTSSSKLEYYVDLEQEFPQLMASARQIVAWVRQI